MRTQYGLSDLLYLMRRLRDRDSGCPWDIEQTFESIAPHTLEEAYEVVDCIERGDFDHLKEELGDLLFQVVYHSQMASEENRFTFSDVVETLVAKLISRHPHVFPAGELFAVREPLPGRDVDDHTPAGTADSEWVRGRWEERKAEERARKNDTDRSALADIPGALPGLSRLQKLQKRASRTGFPSRSSHDILRSIARNAERLSQSLSDGGVVTEGQIGDLLFECTDLARLADVDTERASRRAGREFEQLFRALELSLEARGQSMETLEPETEERYRAQLKQRLK